VRYRAGQVTVLQGDVYALTPELAGTFDRIWDRAALVALPPEMRQAYVPVLRSLAHPGARVLQNAFTYDPGQYQGPPFSVSGSEVATLYSGAEIERVRHESMPGKPNVDGWVTSTYRITLPT
jgi:thiopurine S-methyltransferase